MSSALVFGARVVLSIALHVGLRSRLNVRHDLFAPWLLRPVYAFRFGWAGIIPTSGDLLSHCDRISPCCGRDGGGSSAWPDVRLYREESVANGNKEGGNIEEDVENDGW